MAIEAATGWRPNDAAVIVGTSGGAVAAAMVRGRGLTIDTVVGEAFARVLCGGDLSEPAWVSEQYILDLEREAFLSLCGEPRSQERIWHILQTGKPLRN